MDIETLNLVVGKLKESSPEFLATYGLLLDEDGNLVSVPMKATDYPMFSPAWHLCVAIENNRGHLPPELFLEIVQSLSSWLGEDKTKAHTVLTKVRALFAERAKYCCKP